MADRAQAATGAERRARLGRARLYLVLESRVDGGAAEPLVEAALAGGVDIVQLRDKDATDEELVAAGRRLGALCAAARALLIVNDRPDLALACGADGVHVGQGDEHPDAVRHSVGDELLIGLSTHSPDQVAAAERSAADYLGVGPVYATATKPDVEPVGLELVRQAAAHADKPFFAIGGIDSERAVEVAGAGAERIAVVRPIRDADDPLAAARALREALEREPVGGAGR
ncbi:MAG TPA: thiamine phosphate synthase [Thermoleophilaceae bacterium]|nr:thiamine phosphate synthase [Thermoleophilaceae bacterium]